MIIERKTMYTNIVLTLILILLADIYVNIKK